MTNEDILNSVYDWINYTLNTLLDNDIDIIRNFENAPRPNSNYISFSLLNMRHVGKTEKSKADSTGNRYQYIRYESTIEIQEIGGYGDYLNNLIDYIESENVKNYLTDTGITILNFENIIPVPDLTENEFEIRHNLDCHISFTNKITEETEYIEEIEYTNNI